MLDCTIMGVSQDMDFEQSVTLTYLLVRLPNGTVIRAAIDEDAAADVIALQVKEAGAPTPAVKPQVRRVARPVPLPEGPPPADTGDFVEAPPADEDDGPRETVHVFGGQDDTKVAATEEATEEDAVAAEGSPTVMLTEEAPKVAAAPTRSNVQRLRNGKLVVPSRTVPAAAGGYPNAPNAGLNPEDFTGSNNRDEDGVGSV